jgi:hypothetical protein
LYHRSNLGRELSFGVKSHLFHFSMDTWSV